MKLMKSEFVRCMYESRKVMFWWKISIMPKLQCTKRSPRIAHEDIIKSQSESRRFSFGRRLAASWFVGTICHCAVAWFADRHWGNCFHGPSMLATSQRGAASMCMFMSPSLLRPFQFPHSSFASPGRCSNHRERKVSCMLNCWRRFCSPCLEPQSQSGHMTLQCLSINVFGKDVTAIVISWNFGKRKVALPQPVLYPQVCGRQVANFAQASPSAYPNCS